MKIHLVAIAKNEALYLEEWLAYHLWLGVDRITVIDNESTDKTAGILKKAATVFPVYTYVWPTVDGKSPQLSAYNHYHQQHQDADTLTGFIDIDEFIISRNGTNPIEHLRQLCADASIGTVCINQRVFGDSGLLHYDPTPVLKRLSRCSAPKYEENHWVKSFYRLPYVEELNVHSSLLNRGRAVYPDGQDITFESEFPLHVASRIDGSIMQLNHYITKTLDEFRNKQNRGGAAATTIADRMARMSESYFFGRQPFLNELTCGDSELVACQIDGILADFRSAISE